MEEQDHNCLEYKVILLGSQSVGKTSIIHRAINRVDFETSPTVGVSHFTRTYEIDRNMINLNIWDTAGQEKYRSIATLYYRGANAIVFVYSLDEEQSLKDIVEWYNNVKNQNLEDVKFFLVANKSDLVNERKVSQQQGDEMAKRINAEFIEVSAVAGNNIEELFNSIAYHCSHLQGVTNPDPIPNPNQDKKCCSF